MFANVDTGVLERIAKIMTYLKNTVGKKMKKKDREEILSILQVSFQAAGLLFSSDSEQC